MEHILYRGLKDLELGFRAHSTMFIRNPQNSLGNYEGPYSRLFRAAGGGESLVLVLGAAVASGSLLSEARVN